MSGIDKERATTVVAIVSSNYLLRLGLQRIVEDETWIRLIGQSAHGTNLEDILTCEQPHIVILDTEIESAVSDMIRTIKTAGPGIKVILLAGFDDIETTRHAFSYGVDGIVLKIQPSPVLIATIDYFARTTARVVVPIANRPNQLELSHALPLSASSARTPGPPKWPDSLTERERDVVRLISEGLPNKDIADRLCISSITVRHHLTNIFDKLGVSNRQKLLIRAHQQGLVVTPALA